MTTQQIKKKKSYSQPAIQSSNIVAVVPLAAIGLSATMLQMASVGALAGAAAVGVAKMVGHHHLVRTDILSPTD